MGYEVQPETLQDVADILRRSADELDTVGEPPPGPEAGAMTGAITATLAQLGEQAASFSAGLLAAADAVEAGGRMYEEYEQEARANLPKPGPRPI